MLLKTEANNSSASRPRPQVMRSVKRAEDIVGVWELESMSSEYPDGTVVFPLGQSPRGRLIYTPDGSMAVQLGSRDAAKVRHTMADMIVFRRLAREPWLIFQALKMVPALFRFFKTSTRYIAYNGTYTVSQGQVSHHVESALFPDWEGDVLERGARFDEEGRLELLARNAADRQRVVWRYAHPLVQRNV